MNREEGAVYVYLLSEDLSMKNCLSLINFYKIQKKQKKRFSSMYYIYVYTC